MTKSISHSRKVFVLAVLGAALLALILLGASVGLSGYGLKTVARVFWEWLSPAREPSAQAAVIVFELRLPRVLLALVAGAGLALAGTGTQAVLMNPLVSPAVLGISSGAAFGAALALVLGVDILGLGRYLVVANAFVTASAAMILAYVLARLAKSSRETIILSGIAVGYIFSGLVSLLQYVAKEEDLREVVFWLMGSLWDAQMETVWFLAPVVLLGLLALMFLAWDLNALGAGEETAHSLGVRVGRVRLATLLLSTLLTASVVSFTGAINFIGLMAPHITRSLIGSDHRFLVPASALVGAGLLLAADTAARSLVWPVEMPVGIMTALLGGPFFLYLLARRRKDWLS